MIEAGMVLKDRYALQKPLGDGTFGTVWLGHDSLLGNRPVAVKVLKAEFVDRSEMVTRFEAEADALALLQHPNVVAVLDRGVLGASRFMVVEYVEGVSLEEWLKVWKDQRLLPPLGLVQQLFDQLCAGVEAAHRVRSPGAIVHRDLKPANVRLRDLGGGELVVKVLDFGIAQLGRRQSTNTGMLLGTPLYMAPEQAMGQVAGVGTWTDVFALGVLLVEMLSLSALARGEEPFWAAALQKPEGLPGLVTTRRLDVPPAVWQVALAALQATASQRPSDASALRAALKGAWGMPGVAATQASAPPRPVGFQSVNFGMETLASPAGGTPVTPATPTGFAPTGLAPTVGATPIPMGGTPVPAVAPPLAPLSSGGMPPTMAMPSFGGTLATPPGGAASALPGMPGWNPASSGASAYGQPTPKKMSDLAFWALVGTLAVLLLGGLSVWALHRRDGDDEHQGQSHGATPDAAVPEAPVPPTPPTLPHPTPTPPLVPIPPPQEAARRVVPLEDSPVRGPLDALVTLVEFSEFQCPFCSRVQPTLQQLTERYPRDLRIVWKHRPLPFHQQARPAAEASLAAHAQGRFWEMHDQLFANQRSLAPELYEDLARNIELDRRPFRRAMEDHSFLHVLERDQALSERLRHNMGTPTFYANGRELVGAQPLDRFVTVIEACRSEALETLRTDPSVTREGYYDHLMARVAAAPGGAPAP